MGILCIKIYIIHFENYSEIYEISFIKTDESYNYNDKKNPWKVMFSSFSLNKCHRKLNDYFPVIHTFVY